MDSKGVRQPDGRVNEVKAKDFNRFRRLPIVAAFAGGVSAISLLLFYGARPLTTPRRGQSYLPH
jgi:hypothetical protein